MVEGETLLVLRLSGRCQHSAAVPQPAKKGQFLESALSAVRPCSNIGAARQGWPVFSHGVGALPKKRAVSNGPRAVW